MNNFGEDVGVNHYNTYSETKVVLGEREVQTFKNLI